MTRNRFFCFSFFIFCFLFLTGCNNPALVSESAAMPMSPSLALPMPTMPIFPPHFTPLPIPANFAEDFGKVGSADATLTMDYEGNANPNDPCKDKGLRPSDNARSVLQRDGDTLTRVYYTADGRRIGFYQGSVDIVNGEKVFIKFLAVDKAFQGRGIATEIFEHAMVDAAREFGTDLKFLIADKNSLSYKCLWSRNPPEEDKIFDGKENLPYMRYNSSKNYWQPPQAPAPGEFQIPMEIWSLPIMPIIDGPQT